MSSSFHCQQFDSGFAPKRLGNWEVPADRVKTPLARPPGWRTISIVDDNGHLLPGVSKRMTSFPASGASARRWPSDPNAPYGGVATMGYKGNQTAYLATSTVMVSNNPDSVRSPPQIAWSSRVPFSPLRFSPRSRFVIAHPCAPVSLSLFAGRVQLQVNALCLHICGALCLRCLHVC